MTMQVLYNIEFQEAWCFFLQYSTMLRGTWGVGGIRNKDSDGSDCSLLYGVVSVSNTTSLFMSEWLIKLIITHNFSEYINYFIKFYILLSLNFLLHSTFLVTQNCSVTITCSIFIYFPNPFHMRLIILFISWFLLFLVCKKGLNK